MWFSRLSYDTVFNRASVASIEDIIDDANELFFCGSVASSNWMDGPEPYTSWFIGRKCTTNILFWWCQNKIELLGENGHEFRKSELLPQSGFMAQTAWSGHQLRLHSPTCVLKGLAVVQTDRWTDSSCQALPDGPIQQDECLLQWRGGVPPTSAVRPPRPLTFASLAVGCLMAVL